MAVSFDPCYSSDTAVLIKQAVEFPLAFSDNAVVFRSVSPAHMCGGVHWPAEDQHEPMMSLQRITSRLA